MEAFFKDNVTVLVGMSGERPEIAYDIENWYSRKFKEQWRKDAPYVFGEPGTGKKDDIEQAEFLERIKAYMKKYAPLFSYAGMGSERVAFITADEWYCLKLTAPNDAYYSSQIETETKIYAEFGKPECVYSIVDWDTSSFASQLCECCKQATEQSWRGLFGIPYRLTMDLCDQIARHGGRLDLPEKLKEFIRLKTAGNPEFIDKLVYSDDPKYVSLRSWIEIRARTKMQKLRDSTAHIENWGISSKNGKPAMKLIDAGL